MSSDVQPQPGRMALPKRRFSRTFRWSLAALCVVSASPALSCFEEPPFAVAERDGHLIQGNFEVTQRRSAQDTPASIQMHQAEARYLKTQASFGDTAAWRDDITCKDWTLEATDEPPPFDPAVEDLLDGELPMGWYRLHCDGPTVDHVYVVSPDMVLSRTRSGASWLVWSRPAES